MSFKKTEAIVIKTLNLREADKIVTFFSRDYGKIQGIARGARKIRAKQGGNFELFTRLNVIFFQKADVMPSDTQGGEHALLKITQADMLEAFPAIHADFNKLIGASYIAECLNRAFEPHDQSHQAVYALTCGALRALAAAQHIRPLIPAFEIKLIAHLGYAPVLHRCTVCQTPRAAVELPRFSFATGGLLCSRCAAARKEAVEVSNEAIDALSALLRTDMAHVETLPLPPELHQEIKHLLTNYMQYHLGIALKTDMFVQKLRAANR